MTTSAATLLFFEPRRKDAAETAVARAAARDARRDRRLLCAACRHPVTTEDERIAVAGSHTHRFTNPHGLAFHIGCFARAPGCAGIGEATGEHTWFQGYAWRIAVCGNCQAHLGWRFEGADDVFHGLIIARIVSAKGR